MPDSLPAHLQRLWQLEQDARRKFEDGLDAWNAARLDSMLKGLMEIPTLDSATTLRNRIAADRRLDPRIGEHCFVVRHLLQMSFEQEPTVQQLVTVRTATLLVRGMGRNLVSDGADTLLRILPDAQLISLAGTGHDPWLDWPDAFFAHVHRFLRGTLPNSVLRRERQVP
jgi:pimeloyl-ACP methyl ester carboxylesterase